MSISERKIFRSHVDLLPQPLVVASYFYIKGFLLQLILFLGCDGVSCFIFQDIFIQWIRSKIYICHHFEPILGHQLLNPTKPFTLAVGEFIALDISLLAMSIFFISSWFVGDYDLFSWIVFLHYLILTSFFLARPFPFWPCIHFLWLHDVNSMQISSLICQ